MGRIVPIAIGIDSNPDNYRGLCRCKELKFVMADVYILYSSKLNKYYVGSCLNFEERLNEHLDKTYKNSFTTKADDWVLHFRIENLDYKQVRLIEQHIKNMKSRKFIADLKIYPELVERLISKYKIV